MISRVMLWLCLLAMGAALAVVLGGCGDTFNTPVKREYTRTETRVLWFEVKDEAALYAACGQPEKAHQTLACAVMSADRGTCTVYTHQNPPLEILGHEFLHCFTGRWHG